MGLKKAKQSPSSIHSLRVEFKSSLLKILSLLTQIHKKQDKILQKIKSNLLPCTDRSVLFLYKVSVS